VRGQHTTVPDAVEPGRMHGGSQPRNVTCSWAMGGLNTAIPEVFPQPNGALQAAIDTSIGHININSGGPRLAMEPPWAASELGVAGQLQGAV
jgi:hypothetical protein